MQQKIVTQMIAKLTGILDSTDLDSLILDVGGVGYLISASARTFSRLPDPGQKVSLLIDCLVRNEQTCLFGFCEKHEQDWFRILLNVQGVGAKVALAILSALSPDELAQAIATQDRALITRADGVGPKLATRIMSELKDKVAHLGLSVPAQVTSLNSGLSEAISALTNLGYKRSEAVEAVAKAAQQHGATASTEVLIRAGLSLLSQVSGMTSTYG